MSFQFDASAFLDLPIDVPLVRRPPIPPQDYLATIKDVTVRQWQSKDKVDDSGRPKSGIAYDVKVTIEVPEEIRAQVGMNTPTLDLTPGIMLDMTADGRGIDSAPGKNGTLRRWRDALDMNKPGESFVARAMIGKMLMVKIGHREYPAGSGDFFEEVSNVSKLPGG